MHHAFRHIIAEYFFKNGFTDAKQVFRNPAYLKGLITNLLKESKLAHRKIANLLEISSGIVQNVNLSKG